jgi:deoxyadenosine/deoxycytidine kinase
VRVEVAGAIAVGKSTLVRDLEDRLPNAAVVEEHVDEWTFLERFYADQERWAFHSRMELLAYKAQRWAEPVPQGTIALHDRGMHELITFARVLQRLGKMSSAELRVYEQLYGVLVDALPAPDRIVWVRCDTNECIRRIRQRNRVFEHGVTREYLDALDGEYSTWIDELDVPSYRYDTTSTSALDELMAFLR